MKIEKPLEGEYNPYTINYISLLPDDGLVLKHLEDSLQTTTNFVLSLPPEKLFFQYAEGKWTIKEVLVHMIDAERIFAYRALCFARNDRTDLPGFEEDHYTANSGANERGVANILKEYAAVRNATISLLEGFDEKVLTTIGSANGHPTSVRALVYQIAGHELHHLNIIKERYL